MKRELQLVMIVCTLSVALVAAGAVSAEDLDSSRLFVKSIKEKVGHQYRLVRPDATSGIIFDKVECVTVEGKNVCFGNNVLVMNAHENFTVMDALMSEKADDMAGHNSFYKIRFSRSDRVGYMTVASFDACLRSHIIAFLR